ACDGEVLKHLGSEFHECLIQSYRLATVEAGKSLVCRGGIVDVAAREGKAGAELLAEISDHIKAGANAGTRTIQRFVRWSAEEGFRAKTDVSAEGDRSDGLDLSLQVPNTLIRATRVLVALVGLGR